VCVGSSYICLEAVIARINQNSLVIGMVNSNKYKSYKIYNTMNF